MRVRARALIGDGSVALDLANSPISAAEVPLSIILYTARTQESVVLDDASTSSTFGGDEYIRQACIRSALCVPLIKQGRAVAFLYLENNLATRVFTPARIAILRFLASEAATSLDNARLYRELQERERRYREAQMELAHANRVAVMGQLTASIAHEVNQPNTAVISSAQAALTWLDHRPPALQHARKALTRVVENSIRSSEVIGRIRDLVKKAPPKRDSLVINNVIAQVIELTQVEAARNGVSIRTAFADRLPKVPGDRVELQQVTLNLILNAIEAMSETAEGKRELLIRTARTDAESIVVSIADSGPGLSPEGLARLFEPFYTTKPGGLGVGLSICRSIIISQGGRLWAAANEPRGAVFQFTVPIDDGPSVG
ncbi:C4-dicarboxylate-specific signal transduction histidine kinase [Bradyrhizobium sp. LB7.2]